MEQMSLISVIVPVYKVESYLGRCISSIASQTYSNLEIILVEDGSPDRSGEICDKWAKKDSRIRVIHQENAGGGAARNVALDCARGALIAFVDSDDYIATDMYEHLHEMITTGADIAECGHMDVWDSTQTFPCEHCGIQVYTTEEAMAEHINDRIFRQLIWNKLYRREVIGDIRFPVGKKIDDEFFTYQVLGNARKLIRSEKVCYAYRQQESSVMHTMSADKRLQAVEAKMQRHNYIQDHFPELIDLSLKELWFTCMYQGQLSLRCADPQTQRNTLAYLRHVLREYPFHLVGCTTKEKMWLAALRNSFSCVCALRNMLKIGL